MKIERIKELSEFIDDMYFQLKDNYWNEYLMSDKFQRLLKILNIDPKSSVHYMYNGVILVLNDVEYHVTAMDNLLFLRKMLDGKTDNGYPREIYLNRHFLKNFMQEIVRLSGSMTEDELHDIHFWKSITENLTLKYWLSPNLYTRILYYEWTSYFKEQIDIRKTLGEKE